MQVMPNLGLCDAAVSNPALIWCCCSDLAHSQHSPSEIWPPFPSALLHLICVRFPLELRLLEGTNPNEFMSALNYFPLRIIMKPT